VRNLISHRLLSVVIALGILSAASSARACAACFGKSDDAMAKGMNMGIFTLLVFVFVVLSGVATFAVFLARRSAQFQASSTGAHAPSELASSVAQPSK
jgi:hypothetical protein